MRLPNRLLVLVAVIGLASGLTGCASTGDPSDNDPLEGMNRVFHKMNDTLDDNVLRPIAEGYVAVTPNGFRRSVTNFFNNASYPGVIVNEFLQGKVLDGFEGIMRFTINTTFGIGGLFDLATDMDLPARNEDFGQTLGVWGMEEIAYLELPLLGPSSVRDLPGFSGFVSLLNFVNSNALSFPLTALNIVNSRANLSSAIAVRDRSALDPYIFTREAYRQRRQFLIYDGDPPDEEFDKLERQSSADGTAGESVSEPGQIRQPDNA
ncbi:MAG: VacJ family lipoprotein [Gammaproteobacteria bacterium]|nr:VacJ family lipoprotein [Gammaproteobacteria bacterium]